MRNPEKDISLGLRLSLQVLSREISLDEALIRAHSGGALEDFVRGLNVFSQGEYFHLPEMEARLRSGDAQRAIEGKIPLLDLPPEVVSTHHKASPQDWERIQTFLEGTEQKIRDLQRCLEENLQRLDLMQSAARSPMKRQNPWLASAVILLLFAVFSVILLVFLETGLPAGILFLVGAGLSGKLFVSEMHAYKRYLERMEREARKRRKQMENLQAEMEELRTRISDLQSQGVTQLDRMRVFTDDEKSLIRGNHPLVFSSVPPASMGSGQTR